MTPISRFPIAGLSQAQRPALWRGDFYQLRDGGLAHSAYDIFVVDAPQATSRRYKGLPIVATINGTVPLRVDRTGTPGSGTSDRGGNFVWIADPSDPTGRTYHYFAHLKDPPLVQPGDAVVAGQLIGYLGDSGNARGRPHLHFSVRRPSGAVDVFDQLKAVERSAWLPPVSTGLLGQPWQRWAKVGIGAGLAAGAALIAIYYLWPKTRAANPPRKVTYKVLVRQEDGNGQLCPGMRVALYDGRTGTLSRIQGHVAHVRWDDKPHKTRTAYVSELRKAS